MGSGAATLGAMSNSPNARRLGGPSVWAELARPDAEQSQRFLAEALALLLADLLRSVLSDASPALPADESAVERYRHLADSLADGEIAAAHESRHHARRARQALCDLAQAAADAGAERPVHARRCANSSMPSGLFPALVRQRALRPLAPRAPDLAPHPRSAAGRQHARGGHRPDRGLRALGGFALARCGDGLTARRRSSYVSRLEQAYNNEVHLLRRCGVFECTRRF